MTISLHEASVGMFVPYLGNLSSLLDRASAHVEARNIDPAVLLNMRLSPTMYSLKQQVGEANRHATVAGALLARRIPHTFSDTEPDIAELKARISAASAPRSTPQPIWKSLSRSRTAPSENSPENRCC